MVSHNHIITVDIIGIDKLPVSDTLNVMEMAN